LLLLLLLLVVLVVAGGVCDSFHWVSSENMPSPDASDEELLTILASIKRDHPEFGSRRIHKEIQGKVSAAVSSQKVKRLLSGAYFAHEGEPSESLSTFVDVSAKDSKGSNDRLGTRQGELDPLHPKDQLDEGVSACAICLDKLSNEAGEPIQTLSCKHQFHHECINQMRRHGVMQVCPLCRVADETNLRSPDSLVSEAVALMVRADRNSQVAHQLDTKIARLFQEALHIDPDNTTALGDLALLFARGRGVAQDAEKAHALWEKAAAKDHVLSLYNLGCLYNEGSLGRCDNGKARSYWERAAELGDADAQANLGIMFDTGRGVQQDEQKAASHYETAAMQGQTLAMFNFRQFLSVGKGGVPKDKERALIFWKMAAAKGLAEASYNVAHMCDDKAEAFNLFQKAAAQGSVVALTNVGAACLKGEGVRKDADKGLRLMRQAAAQGDACALHFFGIYYLKGPEQEIKKATKLFGEAAAKGNVDALYQFAVMHFGSEGGMHDPQEGMRLMEVAAEKGHPKAIDFFRELYADGNASDRERIRSNLPHICWA